jgi:hypothetical protein
LRKNSKIENHTTQYWAGFQPKAMAPRAGGHLGASHASGCATLVHRARLPCPWLTWWHGGRQWLSGPRGDEVNDTSNRGSTGGRRARGGGSGAYRAAAQREVGVEATHRCKSGDGALGPGWEGATEMRGEGERSAVLGTGAKENGGKRGRRGAG